MSSRLPKLYLSFDVEADGPSPVWNSLLQLGVVGVVADGTEVFSRCWNLRTGVGKVSDPKTMEWWATQGDSYASTRVNPAARPVVAAELANLLRRWHLLYRVVWCAYPAAYDWQWLKDLYEEYRELDWPDIGYSARCISTLMAAYEQINGIKDKDRLKNELAGGPLVDAHNAEADARWQAKLFLGLCTRMQIPLA